MPLSSAVLHAASSALRGDGQEGGAEIFDGLYRFPQGLYFECAEGTPGTPVEADDNGARCQPIGKTHAAALATGQFEVRGLIPNTQSAGCDARPREVVNGSIETLRDVRLTGAGLTRKIL